MAIALLPARRPTTRPFGIWPAHEFVSSGAARAGKQAGRQTGKRAAQDANDQTNSRVERRQPMYMVATKTVYRLTNCHCNFIVYCKSCLCQSARRKGCCRCRRCVPKGLSSILSEVEAAAVNCHQATSDSSEASSRLMRKELAWATERPAPRRILMAQRLHPWQ